MRLFLVTCLALALTVPALAQEVGTNDFRITTAGADGDGDIDALNGSVAYNSTNADYLVVWEDDSILDGKVQIFGQRLDGDGSLIGAAFRISESADDTDTGIDATSAVVVYNSTNNQYLVAWDSDELLGGEDEIFGQIVNADGTLSGTNFRISDAGVDGDTGADALNPSVAYNPTLNEYLVVWEADEAPSEDEIYGQRLDATGAEVGTNDFRISDAGPEGNSLFDAEFPDVAYNAVSGTYLVVWNGEDDIAPLVENEEEAFGQLLDGAGVEIGPNDFRISSMGADGDADFDAFNPEVVAGDGSDFFVVWNGDGTFDNEFEIYGQTIDGTTGAEIGVDDVKLSDNGPDLDADYDALEPEVAYNSVNNRYIVTWYSDDDEGGMVEGEAEVFVQWVDASAGFEGTEIGDNDVRISDMGGIGDTAFDAFDPKVVYNGFDQEYLVIWSSDDNEGSLVDNEIEIFGQRLIGNFIPVELTSFDAVLDGTSVALAWETASETNNAGFEVQMRAPGQDGYDALGFVAGNGTTTEAHTYRFDVTGLAAGTHAIRLKQIDFDGAVDYHGTVEVTVGLPGTHVITDAYPNPFNPSAQFSLSVAQNQRVEIGLYNVLGQRVGVLLDGTVEAGVARDIRIDGTGLASGSYFVRISGEAFQDALRVTLMK